MAVVKDGYKQVNILLPLSTVEILDHNRKILGMTKSKYLDFLIRASVLDENIAKSVLEEQMNEILSRFDYEKK